MTSTPGHVLYVAWGFPPAKSGGVFRMMETANVLAEQGWEVTVLACDIDDLRRYAGVDLSTLAGVDPAVSVVRVPMELGPFETDLHRWDERRVDDPSGWRADYERRIAAGFPNSVYALWEEPLLAAARAVHAERPVDLVVASGGPFVCFAAGLALRHEHGIPYVLDYRDSWSLQQFTDERIHGPGSRVHEVEGELLTHAAGVWFVNEPMLQWHEDVYPQIVGKTMVVTNGYDTAALTGLPRPQPHSGPIRFGYLGTVTAAVPLTESLDGYRLARAQDDAVRDSTLDFFGYLGFYHTPHEGIRQQILDAGPDGVTWRGALPKAEVASAYGRLDALVLTFGGTRYVTSGKVFEYMATARPVVSVHDPENAAREVLEGYPLWFQAASLSAADVAAAFVAAADAVRSGRASDPEVVDACLEHARRFERRRCLRPAVTGLAVTAALVRDTAVLRPADSDVVAYVGSEAPAPLRTWVARAGRRLVVVEPSAETRTEPRRSVEELAARLRLAEPGTVDGRLRRLYALVAETEDAPRRERHVDLAERVIESGAGAVWVVAPADRAGVTWAAQAVPGLVVHQLREGAGVPERQDGEHGGDEEREETFETDLAHSARELLARRPAPRARRRQEPVEADGPHGAVVVTSRCVEPGSPELQLATTLAGQTGETVLLLARSGPGETLRADDRRRDSRLGGVRIIRLPLRVAGLDDGPDAGPEAEAAPASDWRHRGGVWRDRRVTVRPPQAVRAAHARFAGRVRSRTQKRPSALDPALVAATRAGAGVLRALGAADEVVDMAGRRMSDLHDRIESARHGAPAWADLYPETRLLDEHFGPLLDRLEWDTLHVADPGVIDAARAAVSRRIERGEQAGWVWHPADPYPGPGAERIPLRQRLAYLAQVAGVDGDEGSPLPAPGPPQGRPPVELPWSRADLPALVGIGARNMAGQGWAWAKAIERSAPGVRTEVVTLDRGSHLSYDADVFVTLETYNTDTIWMREFERHVLDSWTHALLEGGRPVIGSRYGSTFTDEARVLAEAGITVGLLFHGSDIRDPRLHVGRTRWSPFTDAEDSLVRTLQVRRDVLAEECRAFDGPVWVSTPDLLADLPGSRWLPVVVDVARWASETPPLARPVPVVVHAPSRGRMKGSDLIEESLVDLRREGVIDYRRVEGVSPSAMTAVIGDADIVLDQFALGSYGVAAVEAMAAGRVVLGHVMDEVRELCPDLPIVEATPATIDRVVRGLLADRERSREIAAEGPRYAARVHDGRVSGGLLVEELRPAVGGSSRGRLNETR